MGSEACFEGFTPSSQPNVGSCQTSWHSAPWAEKGFALLRRGKPKNVAIAAVANRWVRWLHHEMKRVAEADLTSAPARQSELELFDHRKIDSVRCGNTPRKTA